MGQTLSNVCRKRKQKCNLRGLECATCFVPIFDAGQLQQPAVDVAHPEMSMTKTCLAGSALDPGAGQLQQPASDVAHPEMSMNSGMRIIRLQDLPELQARCSESKPNIPLHWMRKKCRCRYDRPQRKCQCQVLTCLQNSQADLGERCNAFFDAFLRAYNDHQDILLSPDDVWLVVCFQFSKYVNDHAEEMRSLVVGHEGQKNLTVTTWNEGLESNWEEFLALMKTEIAKNTNDGIVDVLQANFSTTGLVEKMISTATVMDSFKKYFSYGRCIPLCGIRNACFLGTSEDWDNLLAKTERLRRYDVDGAWLHYINCTQDILKKMVATYHGNVDVDWWNKVMNMERGSLGSGSTTYYSGWILHLFGLYQRCESNDIGNYSLDVPVKIDNKVTGELKTVHLVGGFGGVQALDVDGRKAFRPQTSMIVFYDPNSKEDADAARKHFGF